MNTLAQKVADICANSKASCLTGGYAVMYNGKNVELPLGVIEKETRNNDGRCTYCRVRFSDDSILEFRWSDALGPRFSTKNNKVSL